MVEEAKLLAALRATIDSGRLKKYHNSSEKQVFLSIYTY